MKLSFRWFGENDPVKLDQIKQIPNMENIVSALYNVPVGETWPQKDIKTLKNFVEKNGLKLSVIESLPVHESIKMGLPDRDRLIENYKESLRNLASEGIKTVCYNFMPVFDWTRTQLDYQLNDGSKTLIYNHEEIQNIDPLETELNLPGWDESFERTEMKDLIMQYQQMSDDDLWENLSYFLNKVLPVAVENDIYLTIHPDDPPFSIFGIPRIITGEASYKKLLEISEVKNNGICFCTGSLGCLEENDLPYLINKFGSHIHFVHMRNVSRLENYSFIETGHLSEDGSIDMKEVVHALKTIGYDGTIRPDHGRMIWGESGKPGYGLYDRALGATYLNGLIEGVNINES